VAFFLSSADEGQLTADEVMTPISSLNMNLLSTY
jgi:hypothetical protein